jgi:hypothetical protein
LYQCSTNQKSSWWLKGYNKEKIEVAYNKLI